jgi:hypothetical protein
MLKTDDPKNILGNKGLFDIVVNYLFFFITKIVSATAIANKAPRI